MRKLIIAALLLASFNAHAVNYSASEAEWKKAPEGTQGFCIKNDAGGDIVATASQKGTGGKLLVFSTTPKGVSFTGTWELIGKTLVHVQWDNGRTSTFDINQFRGCTF